MKTVSPFELAICQITDPEGSKEMRAEKPEEKAKRFNDKLNNFMSKIKTTGKMKEKKAKLIIELPLHNLLGGW